MMKKLALLATLLCLSLFAGAQNYPGAPKYQYDGNNNIEGLSGLATNVQLPKGQGNVLYDVAIAASTGSGPYTSTITSATAAWSSADVGKLVSWWNGPLGALKGVGTIASVQSSGAATLSLTTSVASPLTGSFMVYGPDQTAQVQSALATAKLLGKIATMGDGITCISSTGIVIPDGVTLNGPGRIDGFAQPELITYNKSVFSLCGGAYTGSYGFVTMGDGTGGGDPVLNGVNVDSMIQSYYTVYQLTASKIYNSLAINPTDNSGNAAAIHMAGGSLIYNTTAVSHNTTHGIIADTVSDVTVRDSAVFGAGGPTSSPTITNVREGIKFTNVTDGVIDGNHIWKSGNESLYGPSIRLEVYSGATTQSIKVIGNTCDTSYGACVDLNIFDSYFMYSIGIIGNTSFQNDGVPPNTFPFIQITGDSTGTGYLKGLAVVANVVESSYVTTTQGTASYFINATTMPNFRAFTVSGNTLINNNSSTPYNGVTPNYSGGNVLVPSGSGTTTTF
jgi:hypothetical protein